MNYRAKILCKGWIDLQEIGTKSQQIHTKLYFSKMHKYDQQI